MLTIDEGSATASSADDAEDLEPPPVKKDEISDADFEILE